MFFVFRKCINFRVKIYGIFFYMIEVYSLKYYYNSMIYGLFLIFIVDVCRIVRYVLFFIVTVRFSAFIIIMVKEVVRFNVIV